jgi:HAD-hyrolase-like
MNGNCALIPSLSLPIFTLDIAGANGANWSSVLVKTGVYDPSQGHPSYPPNHCADDVEEAVKWALEQHLEGGLRSM